MDRNDDENVTTLPVPENTETEKIPNTENTFIAIDVRVKLTQMIKHLQENNFHRAARCLEQACAEIDYVWDNGKFIQTKVESDVLRDLFGYGE